jgi:hypothetical protein
MRRKFEFLIVAAVLLCMATSAAHAQGSTRAAFPSLMRPLAPSVASDVQISSAIVPAGLDQDHVVKAAGEHMTRKCADEPSTNANCTYSLNSFASSQKSQQIRAASAA